MPDEKASSALAIVRLEKANQCLQAAEKNFAMGLYMTSVNRSYYCIFHSMRAVLALDKFDSKKHSGVISQYRRNYIKTGLFPTELSQIITDAFLDRNDSDYMDFYSVSKEDAKTQLLNAKIFYENVLKYINNKINQSEII